MIGMSYTCASSDSLETPPAPFLWSLMTFRKLCSCPSNQDLINGKSGLCVAFMKDSNSPLFLWFFKLNLKKRTTQKRITEPSSHAKGDPNRFITLNKDLHSQNTPAKSHVLPSHQSSTDSLATNQPAFLDSKTLTAAPSAMMQGLSPKNLQQGKSAPIFRVVLMALRLAAKSSWTSCRMSPWPLHEGGDRMLP